MKLKYFLSICFIPFLSCISGEVIDNKVLPGSYSFENYIPFLKDKTVGVVANYASLVDDVHLVDTLINADFNIGIKTIFSPEHGFSGKYEAGNLIEKEGQELTSIEIVSLYGKNKKPQSKDLDGIDIMVFDLQDVGVRFYTYISTLHYVMQACAENKIPLIVLDRPNPHCSYVDGPLLADGFESFVGMHKVPVVYGMTIGEYALMINGEGWLGEVGQCDLKVVRNINFARDSYYEFPVKPSPNLPNMFSVYLYPSLCLFEGTVVSVGRGTDFPFQVYGHPDFQNCDFSFTPVSIPGVSINPKHKGEKCCGTDLRPVSVESVRLQKNIWLEYLLDSYNELGLGEGFFTNYFDLLAGTDKLRKDILAGKNNREIRESWQDGLIQFKKIREKYLLYKKKSTSR